MKLHKNILIFGTSLLLLAACGIDEGSTEDADATEEPETEQVAEDTDAEDTGAEESEAETEDTTEGSDESSNEDSDTPEQQAGDVIEAEGGTRTVVATNYNINETVENGPFTVTLQNAQLSQFQPSPDFVDMFGGEDLGMITVQVEVTNNSEDTNTIYPDQGIAVTDTGTQIDADLLMSDDVGGDFHGNVTKSGDVFFFFDGQAKEVSNVRYLVNSGSDENFESFGEDLEFSIDF